MGGRKVVVALSGGVDSSVAALLAREAGDEVVAATLDMTPEDPAWRAAWSCGGDALEAVAAIVGKLGIEHHVLHCYDRFAERVLRPCYEEYAAGRTPNPCCRCNPEVKFGILLDFAREIGAERLLTGHYARLNADHMIERGDDPVKDQSYFLYRLDRAQLALLEFPVGAMAKDEVRRLAKAAGLPTASRPDSQDACFRFPGEGFAETLFRLFQGEPKPGVFRYEDRVVGRHGGIHRFTLGQRKGLNVALGVPGYVRTIDPATGAVELTTDPRKLETASFRVAELNWQCPVPPDPAERLEIQIRYRTLPTPGRVELTACGARVTLEHPARAVTPGQAAVFYRGRTLLGGGVIAGLGASPSV